MIQHSASAALNAPAKPATQVAAKHWPWDVNKRKILPKRTAGVDKERTKRSICNISYSNLLKAVFKAEKQGLTPSPCSGFILPGRCSTRLQATPPWMNAAPGATAWGKPVLCHQLITELTLAHTKLQIIQIFKGLMCSQKYCLWWRAIKLCNNLPREISEIFSSESSPSRSWNRESLWNELLVSGTEKTTNTPPHTRIPIAKEDLSHHLLLFFCCCHRTALLTQSPCIAERRDCHIRHVKSQHFQFSENFNIFNLLSAWFCCNSKKNRLSRFPVEQKFCKKCFQEYQLQE